MNLLHVSSIIGTYWACAILDTWFHKPYLSFSRDRRPAIHGLRKSNRECIHASYNKLNDAGGWYRFIADGYSLLLHTKPSCHWILHSQVKPRRYPTHNDVLATNFENKQQFLISRYTISPPYTCTIVMSMYLYQESGARLCQWWSTQNTLYGDVEAEIPWLKSIWHHW